MHDNIPGFEFNLQDFLIEMEPFEELNDFFIEEEGMFDEPEASDEDLLEEAGAGSLQLESNATKTICYSVSFEQHTGPVFCCHLHPNKDLAITGGEDDKAFIWNTKTGDVLHKIERTNSVTHASFNHDGMYVAVGDISGEIEVFKLDDKLTKVWNFCMGYMSWMKWHLSSNILLAGGDTGEVYIWRIPSGDCKILPSHGSKCSTGQFSKDGKKLLSGYVDGTVKLWEIKTSSPIVEVNSSDNTIALTTNVVSVACSNEYDLYMAGSEDSKILFMNSNGPLQMVRTNSPIECVAFCHSTDLKVCATGALNGEILIWDYTIFSTKVTCDHQEEHDSITTIQWLPDHNLLVGTMMGHLTVYNGESGVKEFVLSGHFADIYNICYDEREQIVLTASEDHTAKLFKYEP